jgi:hypothetical protein
MLYNGRLGLPIPALDGCCDLPHFRNGARGNERSLSSAKWGRCPRAAWTKASNPGLFVLGFPLVLDFGIVVRNAAFIGRIVEAVRQINQQRSFRSDHLIAMGDARRNQ